MGWWDAAKEAAGYAFEIKDLNQGEKEWLAGRDAAEQQQQQHHHHTSSWGGDNHDHGSHHSGFDNGHSVSDGLGGTY